MAVLQSASKNAFVFKLLIAAATSALRKRADKVGVPWQEHVDSLKQHMVGAI